MTPAPSRVRVSVIVPTHERAELCIRAVRSALRQTVPPEEVLVWDDGSGAETRKRLREFVALHPQVHYHEGGPAGNPAAGRNRLIEFARGDWVALLDDDDEWLPDKLARQQPYMDAWDVIGSGARLRSTGAVFLPRVGPVSRTALLRDNVLILSTVTMRRSVMTHGFRENPELAGIEDYCLWLDLADAGARIVATADVVAIYDDTGTARLSNDAVHVQQRLARHMLQRWVIHLYDRHAALGAAIHISRAAKLRARVALRG